MWPNLYCFANTKGLMVSNTYVYTQASLLHTFNATWEGLFHTWVIVHSHFWMCSVTPIVHTSLVQQGRLQNNPFNEERFTPYITRRCYPSYFLMCFSVTICQYFYRLWPRNENSRLATDSSRAHICTHASTTADARDCYNVYLRHTPCSAMCGLWSCD